VRALRVIGGAGLLLIAVAAFTPAVNAFSAWMAGEPRLEPAQAIVVLARGGADADGVLSNASLRRTLAGVRLYRSGLAPLLVFSGGAGRLGEAQARARLARGLGVLEEGVLVAIPVGNTRQEAVAAWHALNPRGVRRILLVADPVDMPRARAAFRRVGFEVLPAPAASSGPDHPEPRLYLLRDLAVELIALAYYRVAGYL